MYTKRILKYIATSCIALMFTACVPSLVPKSENKNTPVSYNQVRDTVNTAKINWKEFFRDPDLIVLIDTALRNNQDLNIILQEINIANNEVRARKGQYLPFVDITAGAGVEKVARYTRSGSVEANSKIAPDQEFPDPLPDFMVAATVSWEVDIWKKLRNAKKSAVFSYLSTIEGKNFMVTNMITEIAIAYNELMAFDNQLQILKNNIEIQQDALAIVKLQKSVARVTELAVRRFEAEVLKNQSRQYHIQQNIVETENRINFLLGRFPQPIARNSQTFIDLKPDTIQAGIPVQLLQNRTDIRQAELALAAAKLDVKVAKAYFYPSLNISGAIGLDAFKLSYLATKPESMFYAIGAGLTGPMINRNAIKANYYSANARQIQAVYNYQQTILRAYLEVANQLSNISNMKKSLDLRSKQVQALTESIDISTRLFKSARADYMEVLLTQRDALESKFEFVETKKQRMNAMVNIYRALGGGWN
ncbi:TolC family protein [soil metagenome]